MLFDVLYFPFVVIFGGADLTVPHSLFRSAHYFTSQNFAALKNSFPFISFIYEEFVGEIKPANKLQSKKESMQYVSTQTHHKSWEIFEKKIILFTKRQRKTPLDSGNTR